MFDPILFDPDYIKIRRFHVSTIEDPIYKIVLWDRKTGGSFTKRGNKKAIRKYFLAFARFNGYHVHPMNIPWKKLEEHPGKRLRWERGENGLFKMRP